MLGRQRLAVGRTRLVGGQVELCPNAALAFLTNVPTCLCSSSPETASTPSWASRSVTSKTRPWPTFRAASFLANAAWTVIAALAHNLLRWTILIGLPDATIAPARTMRRRLLTVPGTDHAKRTHSYTPDARSLATKDRLHTTLERLRAVPPLT
jgi:hypothetical protein